MTAEVIVMNKRGVAMAADSACTHSTIDGKPIKIINSANKLFNLSQKCPIGVVTYNNAAFNGIPWDLLFQDFYSRYTEAWATVEECSTGFLKYLENTPLKGDPESYFKTIAWEMQNRYVSRIGEIFDEDLIDADNLDLTISPNRSNFDDDFCNQIADDYRDLVSKYVDEIKFSKNVTTEIKEKIKANILLALYKKGPFIETEYSGIAICGYGTTEFFPACMKFKIMGSLENRVIYTTEGRIKIDGKRNCSITPLAQRDVMDGFIAGIQKNVESNIIRSMKNLVRGIRRNTISKLRQMPNADQLPMDQIEKIIKEEIANADNKIIPQISHSYEDVTNSMISMVSDLNIPDMAKIAKNLISMTSFRREISNTWETVGGPVDVAVISKIDGFVWIERKESYDSKLNAHTINSFSMLED